MTREKKQEFTLRITQANKTELVEILYEMILVYIEEGMDAYADRNKAQFRAAARKIRGCLNELLASLNLEYELASCLLQLYLYCSRELALAEVRFNPENLQHVQKVMAKLQEAYAQLARQDESGPVMQNSQAVYAGLTYGRNDLTENMADQGMNRGFRV